jgi:hypothetical protein
MKLKLVVALVVLILFSGSRFLPVPSQELEVCLSEEEKKLFTLINNYRKSKKLPTIPFSAALTKVAQLHARDLNDNKPHLQDGCNMHSWSKSNQWSACCYTADHKQASCMWDKPKELTYYQGNGYEIACRYYQSSGTKMTADQALKQWKSSRAHHDVMISNGIWKKYPWKAMGVGIYEEYALVWFGNDSDENFTIKLCK